MLDFFTNKISSVLSLITDRSGTKEVDSALAQLRTSMLDSDVPYDVTNDFIHLVTSELTKLGNDKQLRGSQRVLKAVHNALSTFLGANISAVDSISFPIPSVVMVMGLQGSGKTTTIAKIASYIKKQASKRGKNRNILVASVDFYRPAAIDQLEIMAQKAGVDFYRAQASEPLQATQEIYHYYQKKKYELLLLDTAGRMHIDTPMMNELSAVSAIVKPRSRILVLDAMTGQQSLVVARSFNDAVGFDGACLTKMDSDTRGGAALSFRYVLKKPIFFVGVGERVTDLDMWHPARMLKRILGLGDLETLVERLDEYVDNNEDKKQKRSDNVDDFTLEDFAEQVGVLNKFGSVAQVMRYMPGVTTQKLSQDQMEKAERELVIFKAIINSMTPKERQMKVKIDRSRTQRIAKGSGVKGEDVTNLLNRFQETLQYAKLLKKSGLFKQFFK